MILIHMYTPFHYLQLDSILLEFSEGGYTILTPIKFNEFLANKNISSKHIIFYDGFDASSFSETFLNSSEILCLDAIDQFEFEKLLVPDLFYSFNNFIAAYLLQKKVVEVMFFLDGLLSLTNAKLTFRDKVRGVGKYLLSKVKSDVSYIQLKRLKSGVDLPICSKQISFHKDISLEYFEKIQVMPGLIDLSVKYGSLCNDVLIIAQDAEVVMPEYLKLFERTVCFTQQRYPDSQIFVLKRNSLHDLQNINVKYIKRDNDGESAENVIYNNKPKAVISHFSTVLFNLAITDFGGDIISIGGGEFNKLAKNDKAVSKEIENLYKSMGIEVVI